MPKKNDPLTVEEVTEASDIIFPLFDVVNDRMPKGSTTEDTLKIMEAIAKLGHKNRADKAAKEKELTFGFNKEAETDD